MAAIEIVQSSPAYSAPNVGAAGVRSGNIPSKAPVSTEQNVQQEKQAGQQASEQQVKQAVDQANMQIAGSNESIGFGCEEKLGLLYVQVKDKNSGEVIREIPSKDFIQNKLAMRELVGLLLDTKA